MRVENREEIKSNTDGIEGKRERKRERESERQTDRQTD